MVLSRRPAGRKALSPTQGLADSIISFFYVIRVRDSFLSFSLMSWGWGILSCPFLWCPEGGGFYHILFCDVMRVRDSIISFYFFWCHKGEGFFPVLFFDVMRVNDSIISFCVMSWGRGILSYPCDVMRVNDPIKSFSIDPALRPGRFKVLICVSVCVSVCVSSAILSRPKDFIVFHWIGDWGIGGLQYGLRWLKSISKRWGPGSRWYDLLASYVTLTKRSNAFLNFLKTPKFRQIGKSQFESEVSPIISNLGFFEIL